ncbi:MAG: hypothetical protein AB8C84_10705 [Oligoflexales bacterium]
MLRVWDLGIDMSVFLNGHDLYSGPPRPFVFEFDNSELSHLSDHYDSFIIPKPPGLIQSVDFSQPGFPGLIQYGHAVDLTQLQIIYSRVLVIPVAQDLVFLMARKL